jgi:hypothetical protein
MNDDIMQAAARAYEFASSDDLPASQHGLRAAVSRALKMQREEIAQAIEGRIHTWSGMSDQAKAGNEHLRQAARIAREHGKES